MQTNQLAPQDMGMSSTFCPMSNTSSPNLVRSFGKDFHISYLRYSPAYGCKTTAIVLDERVFLVLKGDHTNQLIPVTEKAGIQGCVDYFIKHLDEAHLASEHLMAVGIQEDQFNLMPTMIAIFGQDSVDRIAAAARALQALDAVAAEATTVNGHAHPPA